MFSAYLVVKRIHFLDQFWTVIIRQMQRLLLA
jgi:hypothetical protein